MLTAFVPVLSESSALGADRYFDYRIENYAEALSDAPVDHVIDTLGETEFARELSVLKPGGRLLSLRGAPNAEFAPDVYLEVQHPCWSCNSNSSSANASAGVR